MPSPSNMELRSGTVTVQPGQDEDQPRSEVEILREQLERANLDRDAELQRRRELEVQLDEAQTLRGRDQPAPVPVKIPIPPLDKYDGTTPITEWWATFLAFISLHNTPEPKAITMLPFYLLGVALQFFNHLEPPCKSSLTRIRDALFERFKPSIPISQRLMKIQQETGETVDNYMFRVRKLSVECTMEEEVVTYFAREGLIDQLRLIVVPQNPKTLEDLRKMATLAEQATTKSPATQSTDIASAVSEGIRMGIAAIQSSMMPPAEEKMAPVNALFEPRQSPKPRTNYGRQQRASNPGPCFRCGVLNDASFMKIKGVTGNYLTVLGMLNIELVIDGVTFAQTVHVISELHYPFILGLDFLKSHSATIDYRANTLNIETNNELHICSIITDTGLARVSNTVVIPSRSETTIQVRVSRCHDDEEVLLEPLHSLSLQHIIAAKCVVKVKAHGAYLKVMNPTYQDIRLKRDQVLATVHELDSDSEPSIFSFDDRGHKQNQGQGSNKSSGKTDLQFDLSNADLDEPQKRTLKFFLNGFKDVFSSDLSQLGKVTGHKHKIETIPGSKPVRKQFYRTSPHVAKEIRRQVDEMLENDIIQPSNSEWHSPVVMVRKKNGQLRFACDYRALNKITIPMSFPLPHLETVFDAIGDSKAQYFTNLDFRSAFWQVEMSEESRHKAAFITQDGVFEWKRMPFGLMNSPITFQTLMSGVLRQMNFKSVLVYIDDVLIFSRDFETHLRDLSQVFSKLREAGLTLEPSKCNFAVKQLKFLGHIISRHGVEVDPEKTKAVSEFPIPKTQKQVRSFLGMANYYRKFIHNYAKIAAPLNVLLRKDVSFHWTSDCQSAFDTLKNALISAPILSYPDPEKTFILTCDASDTAIGYYLSQLSSDNKENVIAYGGKSLSKEEKKYNTSEKELLAVVRGVEAYRPYLVGGKFTIYTDHRALVWLKTAKNTGRLERWALKLQEYDFEIIHRAGKSNYVADALSRRTYEEPDSPDVEPGVSVLSPEPEDTQDDKEKVGIQVNLFYNYDETDIVVIEQAHQQPIEDDRKSLSQLQRECSDFKDIIRYLEFQELPSDTSRHASIVAESKHYSIVNGILLHLFQRRCTRQPEEMRYISQVALPQVLRLDALKQYHDSLAGGGHLGIEKVRVSLIQKYYWPRMHQDIVNYVKSCDRCQLAKRNHNPVKPPMQPMPARDKFECWQIDILGPLQKTKDDYEYILLCIDAGTHWPEAFPLKSQNAKEVANVLFENIFSRYGAPSILFSDRGRNFMSKLINALCEIFEISQYHTSSYKPSTNGLVERQNSVIAQSLRAYCEKDKQSWHKLLPGIMMSFRKSISAHSTEFSPFFLMFGKEMRLPFDIDLQPKDNLGQDTKDYLQEFLSRLQVANEIAKKNTEYHQQKNKERYDRTAREPNFKVGDLVLINSHHVPKGQSAKLTDKCIGPYRITECGSNYTYQLKRVSDNKIHPSLMNAIHLKHYHSPTSSRAHLEPKEPDEDSDDTQPLSDQDTDNIPASTSQPGPSPVTLRDESNVQSSPTSPDHTIPSDQPPSDPPNNRSDRLWNIKYIPSAKFKNGKRLIRVVWENDSRTWEPDDVFPPDVLADINRRFTKTGKRRRTCFKKK
ncbi:hypothetical protein FSP39_004699 [Pinctada imbricata]|uniref:RNA-directed DNA polymerase n=1 Tax=Pinctada imbricata TaxID=66713 RepID=A0AA88YHM1_PINIB|nr:hypothetical protein FSP39_004699 [Pinctada imbricata]